MGAMTTRFANSMSPRQTGSNRSISAHPDPWIAGFATHAFEELPDRSGFRDIGLVATWRLVPESLPGWEQLVEGTLVGLAPRPARFAARRRHAALQRFTGGHPTTTEEEESSSGAGNEVMKEAPAPAKPPAAAKAKAAVAKAGKGAGGKQGYDC